MRSYFHCSHGCRHQPLPAPSAAGSDAPAPADSWSRLSPAAVRHVAALLHPDDATSFALVNRSTAATLHLGLPRRYRNGPNFMAPDEDWLEPHRAQQPWPEAAFAAQWGRPEPWRSLSLPQRRRLLCLAASSGHAASWHVARAHCGCAMDTEVLAAAAAAGHVDACKLLLLPKGVAPTKGVVTAAAWAGQQPALELLLDAGADDLLQAAATGACMGGHARLITWLRQERGHELSTQDNDGYDCDIVRNVWPQTGYVETSARWGHVALVRQLMATFPLVYGVPADALGAEALWADAMASEGCTAASPPPSEAEEEEARKAAYEDTRRLDARMALLVAAAEGFPAAEFVWLWRLFEQHTPGLPEADQWPLAGRPGARLLDSAAGSSTACWAEKVQFLQQRLQGDVGLGDEEQADQEQADQEQADQEQSDEPELPPFDQMVENVWSSVSLRQDYLQRLQQLNGMGIRDDEQAVNCALIKGHADALAYLWRPEGDMQPYEDLAETSTATLCFPCGLRIIVGDTLAAKDANLLSTLQLLQDKYGAKYLARHAAYAARNEASLSSAPEQSLLYLAAEAKGAFDVEAWTDAFTGAARTGASLRLLRKLRERGAAVDLGAVAEGGSQEALEWAVAELEAEGRPPQVRVIGGRGSQYSQGTRGGRLCFEGSGCSARWVDVLHAQ